MIKTLLWKVKQFAGTSRDILDSDKNPEGDNEKKLNETPMTENILRETVHI